MPERTAGPRGICRRPPGRNGLFLETVKKVDIRNSRSPGNETAGDEIQVRPGAVVRKASRFRERV
jgi:hypothetical protein